MYTLNIKQAISTPTPYKKSSDLEELQNGPSLGWGVLEHPPAPPPLVAPLEKGYYLAVLGLLFVG